MILIIEEVVFEFLGKFEESGESEIFEVVF